MHPLQNGSQAEQRPASKPLSGLPGWFTESGDNNVPSYPGADYFNKQISEFQNALAEVGVVFDPEDEDHLAQALKFLSNSVSALKTINSYGSTSEGVNDETQIFIDAAAENESVVIPEGKYVASIEGYNPEVVFLGNALFKDIDTDEFFNSCRGVEGLNLKNAFKDVMSMHDSGQAPKIVCYGDSNTRYYEGDTSTAGPFSKSYGAFIDYLSTFHPHLYAAEITINGYPGETAEYGDSNFAANVPSNVDIVVLGFGTNNVKLDSPDVDSYLTAMKNMVLKSLAQGTTPIVLGIPWFYAAYGANGVTSQHRIKVWNSRLLSFCKKVGVHFIDTYNLTNKYPSAYFNEATQQRHYSSNATRVIATKIVEKLNVIMTSAENAVTNINKWHDLSFIRDFSGSLSKVIIGNGGFFFETLKLEAGTSITIPAAGRGCIAFYPREAANAIIDTGYQNVTKPIIPVTDNSLLYLVDRQALAFVNAGNKYDLQITADQGPLYIMGLSFQDGILVDNNIRVGGVQLISGADLPAVGVPLRKYLIEEVLREATYISGTWFGSEGLIVAGTTAQRNAVQNAPCPLGYKFWNTETQQGERWNGTNWTAV